jgi:hypothetical protein
MYMSKLDAVLKMTQRDKRVLVDLTVQNRTIENSLHKAIPSSGNGSTCRHLWINEIASTFNGDPESTIRIKKENERRCFLELFIDNQWIPFYPLYATVTKSDNYEIHNKGKEIDDLQPLLPDMERILNLNKGQSHGYVLRVIRNSENGEQVEVHFVIGDPPKRVNERRHGFHWYERVIIRMDDNEEKPLAKTYNVPFDPEGAS